MRIEKVSYEYQGKNYILLNAIGANQVPDGKYLYSPVTGQIEVQWIQGIGSDQAAAPQARLMATVINGILNQRLPWHLVALGVFLVLAIELLGIRSLAFAVGSYLSIGTTMAIFVGGVVRWLAERGTKSAAPHAESEVSPGSLYASGLIAAGGVVGLLAIVINVLKDKVLAERLPDWLSWLPLPLAEDFLQKSPNTFTTSHLGGVVIYAALAASLFYFARKKLG